MVKLASARESRMYGPRLGRNRFEYMNAGVYVFATILMATGFAALLSVHPMPGLVLILMGLGLIVLVNLHDLMAHLAGIDYRVGLMEDDMQLGFVEFAVPLLQFLGTLLFFLALIFLLIQGEKGYNSYNRTEKHSMNMLIAGTVLWVVGSVLNSCQIYERADGHVQVLQQSVQIPFLMGSLLFAVASVINYHEQIASVQHGLALLGGTLIWLGIVGSFMLFMGGLTNVIKVFKMQQIDGVRLEKLRGGAQERLVRGREGHVPLILENERRRKRQADANEEVIISSTSTTVATAQTPYKDVLVGQA